MANITSDTVAAHDGGRPPVLDPEDEICCSFLAARSEVFGELMELRDEVSLLLLSLILQMA